MLEKKEKKQKTPQDKETSRREKAAIQPNINLLNNENFNPATTKFIVNGSKGKYRCAFHHLTRRRPSTC